MSSSTPTKIIGVKGQHEYVDRVAVRLLLRNTTSGEIAIIWVEKGQYFKLPGGGVEGDEDHVLAAEREAMEETGCTVRVRQECVATAEEWRNDLHQISHCYEAQLVQDTGNVQMTDEEIQEGLKHQWCSVDEALRKFRSSAPTSELGRFIKERDTFFLEQFKG
jgi:8-oxo-dGTP pyrophosphatase MutT (NUDIX family)